MSPIYSCLIGCVSQVRTETEHEWIADTMSAHHLVSRLCKILLVLDTLLASYMCLRVTQWWFFRISFLYVVQDRVLKCIELLNESSNASVAFLPQSPIGVLDASACLSYKSDETKIGSCTNSSHDSPDSKRRKLNRWTDPMEWIGHLSPESKFHIVGKNGSVSVFRNPFSKNSFGHWCWVGGWYI